ncbi:MAG: metallophosphoesterase family protein [Gammaproteobacteria bacterium]|nr:metallophosphoesterase family protein [Gammaproteobacteria bacterium]MCP5201967.1 metallophosphoesterase family protein [Gammaproteobacteria bacterium]
MTTTVTQRWPAARRIALLADTHGALADDLLPGLAAADLVVHAGDVGGGAVLDTLAALAPTLAVAGNNDVTAKWPRDEAARLAALPAALAIELRGGTLVVVHGHQWSNARLRHARLRAAWPRARLVVYGHSHRRLQDASALPWVVNPGAAGRARAYGGAGWLGLSVGARDWYVAENGFAPDQRVPPVPRQNEGVPP